VRNTIIMQIEKEIIKKHEKAQKQVLWLVNIAYQNPLFPPLCTFLCSIYSLVILVFINITASACFYNIHFWNCLYVWIL
jgi:hypothetical protein